MDVRIGQSPWPAWAAEVSTEAGLARKCVAKTIDISANASSQNNDIIPIKLWFFLEEIKISCKRPFLVDLNVVISKNLSRRYAACTGFGHTPPRALSVCFEGRR